MALTTETRVENFPGSTSILEQEEAGREQAFANFDQFVDDYLLDTPTAEATLPGCLRKEPVHYNHLVSFGEIAYDDRTNNTNLLVVIREAPDLVRRNRSPKSKEYGRWEHRTSDWWNEMYPASYLVVTTDGEQVTKWQSTYARWSLSREGVASGLPPIPTDPLRPEVAERARKHQAAKRAREPQFDELVIELTSIEAGKERPQRATMWLSRSGGTFRLGPVHSGQDSGWLLGLGSFANGPAFLDDPKVALSFADSL